MAALLKRSIARHSHRRNSGVHSPQGGGYLAGLRCTLLSHRSPHIADAVGTPEYRMSAIQVLAVHNSDRSRELRDRVRSCLFELMSTESLQMIDNTISLAREAFSISSEPEGDRVDACLLLAVSLWRHYERTGDDRLLDEAIDLQRQALNLCPMGHPHRSTSCDNLGTSLMTRYRSTGDDHLLDEAIDLQRQALDLCPVGDPDHSMCCNNLAFSLSTRYERTGDDRLLDEAIDLDRQALDHYPVGHPGRSLSCNNLAASLSTRYMRTGDDHILDEAINIQRQVLDHCPVGHPGHSMSCNNLALLLSTRYERTGDDRLLDEAIDLDRQALDLCPVGDPGHSMSCNNLAASLLTCYKRTGDDHLLDEAIDLQRQALDLLPVEHPDRSMFCISLAGSFATRYERTGDDRLLDEAIDLQRQALDLCPVGHPHRSTSCNGLGNSLWRRFERTGDELLLDEAIDLQRHALDLCPVGHPDRSMSCDNLGTSLSTRYKRTGDDRLLDEAIDLQRQALDICPAGYLGRWICCNNLVASLSDRYERTSDNIFLDEIFAIDHEAVTITPMHGVWRHLVSLAWVHLQLDGPFYDVSKALMYLSQSLENEHDDIHRVVQIILYRLDDIWICEAADKHVELITIYERLINLLPLLPHPTRGLQPQLRDMKKCSRIGSDSFVNAALSGQVAIGLEGLELAQGVIWSQSLHRRNPQLNGVPEPYMSKLQRLLQAMATGMATANSSYNGVRALTQHDTLHIQSSQLYTLVQKIRALPGLGRFMLGEKFETLRTVATDHPAVVLVGARGHYYALVIASSLFQEHKLVSLELDDEDLKKLTITAISLRQHRDVNTPEQVQAEDKRAPLMKSARSSSRLLCRQLKVLWIKVVKPILDHLGLQASDGYIFNIGLYADTQHV
jgi:tetratricopeptide (TPR) repeat protein